MSTRAYLIEPEFVWIDEKRYVYEAETLLWNHTYNPEIWDVLYPYMNDFTNDECIGYIEITYDVWDSLKMDYMDRANQFGEKVYETVNCHKEVFQTIDQWFKDGNDYIKIKLY